MDPNPSGQPFNPYAAHASSTHPAHTLRGNETCITCGYALTGLQRGSPCPECGTPVADSAGPVAATTVGRYCIRCAYALDGLPVDGKCPECATDIALSLREPTLANADPAYLITLRSGLSFVLNGLILFITVTVFAVAFAAIGGVFNSPATPLILEGLLIVVSGIILFGYWKYTTPDPSQVALEATNSARSTIRVVVLAQAALSVVSFVVEAIGSSITPTPTPGPAPAPGPTAGQSSGVFSFLPMTTAAEIITAVLSLVGMVLWIVQFVSVMRYTRWLATRIPDHFIVRRTKTYPWLLPLIYVLGAACIGLGPLIALVLYWNLLDRVRKHVKSIIKHGGPARN
jgi:hypothetical protein